MEQAEANRRLVEQFWAAMQTNDFSAPGALMHDDFTLEWPQSGERLVGRDDFAAFNHAYPAAGPWRFAVRRIVADERGAVSDVAVTDGVVEATAITFSEIRDGVIVRQVEYWPDPYPAPEWRARWVERYEP
ncbi:MAG TPA: nuclear transport factor 2 family protein [Herpetosiphonaceae bacterium]